ncbi:MAG TPA: 50S ribosomal protein L15 [Patescibacteria group bacterium]|nr:50S ribosomal protein L15 [Patescibacteria group bacterium]
MDLSNIKKVKGNKKSKKIVGRGRGSGKGAHTTGRGQKGQKSRSGRNIPSGFEGGQVPLYKKLPVLGGFKSPNSVKTVIITLNVLNVFDDGAEVTPQSLVERGIIKRKKHPNSKAPVKILGTGDLKKKLTLSGFEFSETARKKVEKSGTIVS